MTMRALLIQALGWTMLLSQDFQVQSHIPGIVDDWSTINSRYRDEQNHWCWSFRVRMDYLERMQRRNTTKGKVETGWKAWKRFRDKTLLERIPNSKTTLQGFWGFRCSDLNWFGFMNWLFLKKSSNIPSSETGLDYGDVNPGQNPDVDPGVN